MTIHGPKFVKKANLWVVSTISSGKQEQKWFNSEKEANDYKGTLPSTPPPFSK